MVDRIIERKISMTNQDVEIRLQNLENAFSKLSKFLTEKTSSDDYSKIQITQVEEKTDTNTTDISDTQDYIDVIMTEVIPSLMGMDSDTDEE